MKRIGSLLILSALTVAAPSATWGMDQTGTRQTAGIFVSVDRRVCTLYLDFVAAKLSAAADGQDVAVTLKTDLDIWIEGHAISSGTHRWTFSMDGETSWSIGETKRKGRANPERYVMKVRRTAVRTAWLTAAFEPDPAKNGVLLHLRLGDKEGTLRLALKKQMARVEGGQELDVVELRAVRDRMCRLAGILASAGSRRPAWSGCLRDLGDALVESTGNGRIQAVRFEKGAERVTLTVKGYMPGDRESVDQIARQFKKGHVARLFEHVGQPLVRSSDRMDGWNFEIAAEASRAEWDRVDPLEAMFDGTDPARLAEEVLLLEARLARVTAGAVADMADSRMRLLSAKREAGVILSEIVAGDSTKIAEGLTCFSVKMKVAGWGPGIIRFLRAVEDWEAPLEIRPVSLEAGDLCPEARVEVIFYHYTPLAERNPGLYAGIMEAGVSENFEEKRALYLEGVGAVKPRPYETPTWTRDPFDVPRTRK